MIHKILNDKPTKIFVGFPAFFVANALDSRSHRHEAIFTGRPVWDASGKFYAFSAKVD